MHGSIPSTAKERRTLGTLQTMFGLEEDKRTFDKIWHYIRSVELKHFCIKPPAGGEEGLFDLIKSELKKEEPTLFGGSQGDRRLCAVLAMIKKIYYQRRWRQRIRYADGTSESALSASGTGYLDSSTAGLGTDSSSRPDVRINVGTSTHSPRRSEDIRKKITPIVFLTRRKNTATRKSSRDIGTIPECRPTHLDLSQSNNRMGEERCSSSVPNGCQDIHADFDSANQSPISSPPSPSDGMSGSLLPPVFRAVPQVELPRRMSGSADATGLSYGSQLDSHFVRAPTPVQELQKPAFSDNRSATASDLTWNDHLDSINTSSFYGPGWQHKKPNLDISSDFRTKEKVEKLHGAPISSFASPSSRGPDRPFIAKPAEESGIAGIHRFLSNCHPPMMQHILRFVQFGCTTTEYLRGVSTWPVKQRYKLLVKILQPERGVVPQMDIAVLENQFETYFRGEDV